MQDGHPTDEQLLQTYATRRDEAAFALLVQRHLNLVFGTILRRPTSDSPPLTDIVPANPGQIL